MASYKRDIYTVLAVSISSYLVGSGKYMSLGFSYRFGEDLLSLSLGSVDRVLRHIVLFSAKFLCDSGVQLQFIRVIYPCNVSL